MTIVSWQFAIFVIVVLAVYYILPYRLQKIWLLIASYAFYAWLGWQFTILLAAMTIANLLVARHISTHPRHRLSCLWLGIGFNILLLVAFKYFDFFKPEAQAALTFLHIEIDQNILNVIVPIGLSFTILQTISFLIDVYRGQITSLPRLTDFALYLAYFPKLTAGPIERARTFIPQLARPYTMDNEALARSFSLIIIGLFRKIVIADSLLLLIPVRESLGPVAAARITGADTAIYLLAYGFHLFNDFAGYTSIVRGVSILFGIELSQNFLTPYFSRSFTEFWNQWHISLSEWLRDYIYFPLTRILLRRDINPRSAFTLVIPPMVTMAASGLWHGATLLMVLWGMLHGLYLVIERIISAYRPVRRRDQQPILVQVISGILIFILVNAAWLLFQSADLAALQNNILYLARPGLPTASTPFLFIGFSLLLDILQRFNHDELFFRSWHWLAQAALLTVTSLLVFTLSFQIVPTFVYQGF